MVNDVKNCPTLGHYVLSHKQELSKEFGVNADIPLWGSKGLVELYKQRKGNSFTASKVSDQKGSDQKGSSDVAAELKAMRQQIKELEAQTPAGMLKSLTNKESQLRKEAVERGEKQREQLAKDASDTYNSAAREVVAVKDAAVEGTTKAVKAGAGGTGAALGNFGEFFKVCADGLKGFAQGFTDYANSK
ncbi:MAG: hypothetical protein WCG23_03430 [bacterium]